MAKPSVAQTLPFACVRWRDHRCGTQVWRIDPPSDIRPVQPAAELRMISDFAFPGTLLALKLLLRVIVHQEFKKVELYKTVLAFPTDVVYLAFTFSAAVLVNLQKSGHQISDVKSFYSATVWIFICTVLVIALSRESLKRFDSESDSSKGHFLCFLIAMAISLFTLGTSTFMIGTI